MDWRITQPVVPLGNPFYNTKSSGGYSSCITGVPTRSGANVLCNCVGFANGAFNETYCKVMASINPDFVPKEYFSLNSNANRFIEIANSNSILKDFVMDSSNVPPLGGVIVWGGTRCRRRNANDEWQWTSVNHVAYIYEIIDENNIKIIQAGYNTPLWSEPVDGGYKCSVKNIYRHNGGHNLWWYSLGNDSWSGPNGGQAKCLGFIANPAIGKFPTHFENTVGDPPEITDVIQTSPTSVKIKGITNGNLVFQPYTMCYYSWEDSISVETGDFYGVVKGSGEFEIEVSKPRDATRITVLPVQNDGNGDKLNGQVKTYSLTSSYPCIQIVDNTGTIRNASPQIYTGGQWKDVIPTIMNDNSWYELYNTDKEKV